MSFPSRTLFLLTIASSALGAESQKTEPVDVLQPFVVNGENTRAFASPPIEIARAELSLTPGGTETIDAARFLRGRASTVEDTFALSPGIIAQSRFGSDEARISIRGSGLQRTFHGRGIRILQDGVPLNLADGSFDMQAFEPLSAAYINVWRGGNALSFGASTLGGAIDYISQTGREKTGAVIRAEIGSWDYARTNISVGSAKTSGDFYAALTHQSQSGFRDHAEQNNQRLFANSGIRFSNEIESRFYLTAVRSDSELPGNLTYTQLRGSPRQAAASNIALHQKRDFGLVRIANKTSVRRDNTTWDLAAAWSYKDLDHPIFQVIDQLSNDWLLSGQLTQKGTLFGRPHRLRAGIFYQRGNMNAANYANVLGTRGALLASAEQTATNTEFFAEDQISLTQKLTLVVGASASINRRENDQRTGATPDYAFDYNRTMPKLGLRWDADGIQFYANVAGSYEPPSFSETLTLNTARRAQTATSYEIGTRGAAGFFRWDFTLYHAALRNELLSLDHDNNPSTAASTVNADRTIHSGAELATEIDLLGKSWAPSPTQRLVLRAAWTHGRFRFDDDLLYGKKTLPGLPPHLIRGEITWENTSGWYAGPTFQWSPTKTFIDFRNTFAAPGHAIAGFRVGKKSSTGFSWFLEARNLFDRRFAATTGVIENANATDQAQFLPGDGRSTFVGAEYRF